MLAQAADTYHAEGKQLTVYFWRKQCGSMDKKFQLLGKAVMTQHIGIVNLSKCYMSLIKNQNSWSNMDSFEDKLIADECFLFNG